MTSKSWIMTKRLSQTHTTTYSGGSPPGGSFEPGYTNTAVQSSTITGNCSMVGDDMSSWKLVIASRGNATNNLVGNRSYVIPGTFYGESQQWRNPYWHPHGKYTYRIEGDITLPALTNPGNMSTAENVAKSQFVTKANQQITSFQSGVFLGELRETLQLIRSPLSGIRNLLSGHVATLKKNRRRFTRAGSKRKLDYLADQWLETAFGIMPLLSDIDSGAEALAKVLTDDRYVTPVRGYGIERYPILESGGQYTLGNLKVDYSYVTLDEMRSTVFGGVLLDPNGPGFVLDKFGANLQQFVPTLWELVPWSFLVDYFSNVGKILEATSFVTNRLSYWGITNTRRRITVARVNGDRTLRDISFIQSIVVPQRPAVLVVESIVRIPGPSLVPSLQFRLPGIKQSANITALLPQLSKLIPY